MVLFVLSVFIERDKVKARLLNKITGRRLILLIQQTTSSVAVGFFPVYILYIFLGKQRRDQPYYTRMSTGTQTNRQRDVQLIASNSNQRCQISVSFFPGEVTSKRKYINEANGKKKKQTLIYTQHFFQLGSLSGIISEDRICKTAPAAAPRWTRSTQRWSLNTPKPAPPLQ